MGDPEVHNEDVIQPPSKVPQPHLDALHKFFDSIRRVVRGADTSPHRSDPKWRKQRVAAAQKWNESEPGRRAMVAVCPKCSEWFETTIDRNRHRAKCFPKKRVRKG